jgi:catechol 2,3-dioxygenase-like lactoylglutathione lyase family enzyme
MARIRHIAITTQDVDATAKFYIEGLGLKEVGKVDSPNAKGYYLSDGHVNLAILNFINPAAAGPEFGVEYSGIHHIGFEVESLSEATAKLESIGSAPRDDINQALGLNHMGAHRRFNVETKYSGPDNVIFDVSETGWVGTHPEENATEAIKAEVR